MNQSSAPIFLDSGGDLAVCEGFILRIGLVAYLKRAIRENTDIEHPKSILGRLAGAENVSHYKKIMP